MRVLARLRQKSIPLFICLGFFIVYATLGILKHTHYLSGYDLGIAHQIVWQYSRFTYPLLTTHAYAFTPALADHVELIYAIISPVYWIFPSAKTLIVLQALAVSLSGIPIYLLAVRKNLQLPLVLALLVSYLSFFGIQQALWNDVHSLAFAVALFPWFIYFLDSDNVKGSVITLFLALFCKEDIGLLTFLISFVYFVTTRKKSAIVYMLISLVYVLFLFFVYYPYLTDAGYRYQSADGLLSDLNPLYMIDTAEKREVLFYSIGWFGFLPIFAPFYLIVALGDLAHYFILGRELVTSAQGLFMHYRSSLAVFLVWPTIVVLARYKWLNTKYSAVYVLFWALLFQYTLHQPLSYLTKSWFWTQPSSVVSLNKIIKELPENGAVVSQNNITPHVSGRDAVFTLWPELKDFKTNSPCGQTTCHWFRWAGEPEYLLVDTSFEWDARHFLTSREDFIAGITALEKANVIKRYKSSGTTTLYTILRQPKI